MRRTDRPRRVSGSVLEFLAAVGRVGPLLWEASTGMPARMTGGLSGGGEEFPGLRW